jgi:two-component system sensor histidine kinase YesM
MRCVRFSGMSIRYKLFFLFLALVLVPFGIYTTITMVQSSRNAEHSGQYSARQALTQAGQFIEARVSPVIRSLQFISMDPDVRRLSVADPAVYESNLTQWIADADRLRRTTLAIGQSDPEISSITLYMSHGLAAFSESQDFELLDRHRSSAWYREVLRRGKEIVWLPPHYFPSVDGTAYVHGIARIPDDLDLPRTAGYVRIDLPERALGDVLDQAQFSASSSAFLLNASGEPIALSVRARGPDRWLLAPAHAGFPPTPGGGVVARTLELRGREYLVDCLYVTDTDWRLVLFVPYEDIDAFGKAVRRQMFFALAIILPLMLPLAFWVASTSTRRIGRLISGVRELERGNLTLALPGEGGDEIGELTGDLNRMASRIASLLEERYRLGQEMKHLEMKALQAQINPHFLYNTLDLVNCLSLRLNVPTIAAVVEALSKFYRLSLSEGAETVTVQQELDHVETYVRIQNMRFDDGISLIVNVPVNIRALPILKIVLQPLVENSILHGIREKKSGRGLIVIRGTLAEPTHGSGVATLVMEIEDDGVGMKPEQVDAMLREEKPHDGHGYGVRNIDRRLKVEYGAQYGLSYRTEPGRGTTATLLAPAFGPDGI